jgi:hypothetical protein
MILVKLPIFNTQYGFAKATLQHTLLEPTRFIHLSLNADYPHHIADLVGKKSQKRTGYRLWSKRHLS